MPDGFVTIQNVATVTPEAALCSIQLDGDDCDKLFRFFLGPPGVLSSDEGRFAVVHDGKIIAISDERDASVALSLKVIHVEERVGGAVTLEGESASFVNPARPFATATSVRDGYSARRRPANGFIKFLDEIRSRWPAVCGAWK